MRNNKAPGVLRPGVFAEKRLLLVYCFVHKGIEFLITQNSALALRREDHDVFLCWSVGFPFEFFR